MCAGLGSAAAPGHRRGWPRCAVCGPAGAGGGGVVVLGPLRARLGWWTLRVPRLVRGVPGAGCSMLGSGLGELCWEWSRGSGCLHGDSWLLRKRTFRELYKSTFCWLCLRVGAAGSPGPGMWRESRIRTQQIDRSPRPFPIDFAANLEQQRVMVEAFKEFALGWSRAGACCAPERTPRIPAQGRACACPWQSHGRAVSADPAGWAGGKTTSWHKRLRFVFGAKFESAA